MELLHLADADALARRHHRLDRAIAWLRDPAMATRAEGRHVIDGEAVFAIVETGAGSDPRTRRYESHRRYTDLQLSLSGGERMDVTAVAGLALIEPFAKGGDIAFYAEPARVCTSLAVLPGFLAVFTQADAHKPGLWLDGTAQAFRKVVVKVDLG